MQQAHNHPFPCIVYIVLDRLVLAQTHASWSPSAYLHIHPCSIHTHALQFSWLEFARKSTMYNEYYTKVFHVCAHLVHFARQCAHIIDLVGGHFQFELLNVRKTVLSIEENAVSSEDNLNYFARLLWLCSSCSYLALPA